MVRSLVIVAVLASCATLLPTREEEKFAIGEAVFQIPAAIDEMQTLTITAECRENNPIIGKCGQNMSVGVYFFTASVLHIAVSWALPPKWRRWWQGLTAGGEISIVWNNHGDGIAFWP